MLPNLSVYKRMNRIYGLARAGLTLALGRDTGHSA